MVVTVANDESVYYIIKNIRKNNYLDFLYNSDPHVRVAGRQDDVKLAREKILMLLDTRSNRVTMKIDVSYTDHSHIIGKGGLTIKRVMEETGCHIHFPDSNRTSTVEKSNQVSIAGDMERVESARARVRALTPLVFCFELPIVSTSQPLPDINSPYVHQIQDQYKVQVMHRSRPKLHANLLVVKGVQWEVEATMEATNLLMNYMCGSLASQTKVQMSLEISPMHHNVVVGHGADQLKAIMKGTETQIMFPDANDPNIPLIKKSCVTITGQIKDVYNARQQLVGSLPLVVIFDVADEACRIDNEAAVALMQKHNVYMNIRRKPKQKISSVVIKGVERYAGDIYEARRELLGGKEPKIEPRIPETYNIPAMPEKSMPNFGPINPFLPAPNAGNSPCSPYNAQTPELGYGLGSPLLGGPGCLVGFGSPMSPAPNSSPVYSTTWLYPSPQPQQKPHSSQQQTQSSQHSYTGNVNSVIYTNQGTSWNPMSNGNDIGGMRQSRNMQPPAENRPSTSNSTHTVGSGYQSNFSGSTISIDTQNTSGCGGSSGLASPSVSPGSKNLSPVQLPDADRSQDLVSLITDIPLTERRAVGYEKKTLEALNQLSPIADYKHLKARAYKAMHEGVSGGYRVPTPRWSGYYFSRTSPSPIQLENDEGTTSPDQAWRRSELLCPNIAEMPSTPPHGAAGEQLTGKPCRYRQLYDLLQEIGLHKYIDLFKQHELDILTFASLNEADLTELGVTAFGARRKMLLYIADLRREINESKNASRQGASTNSTSTPPRFHVAGLAQDKW